MKSIRLCLMAAAGLAVSTVSSHAQSAAGAITGVAAGGSYDYTITLTNTSATNLNSFWYGWTTSGDNLPSTPSSPGNSSGWGNTVSGKSIMWVNSSGTALAPGASATFTFVSTSSPSAITTAPSGESVAYVGGIDFSEDRAGDSTAAFSPVLQTPPPPVPTVTAAITGVASNGSYNYTVTLTNTGSAALNSFWYGWTTSGNNLPSDPSGAANSLGWSNDLSGNSIKWTNSTGTALAPGASATFTFVSSSSPSAITTSPSGESVAYVGGIDFSEDTAGDSTAAFSPVLQTPPPVVPTVTAAITGFATNGSYDYTITLTNTGAAALNSFWYGWTTSGNNLPSDPSSAGNSLGWANTLDGNSIMWVNSSGTALAPGASATFTFVSSSTPSAISTSPSGESVAYVGGIDFSEDTAGDSTAAFSPVPQFPPPPVPTVTAAITGFATNGSYDYTITLTNIGSTALNSFWYGWTTSGNNLPSDPTSAANSLGWSNDLSGNSIKWTNGTGTALAPGASATFTFVSSSTPSAITTAPSGESVAYVGGIDFSEDAAADSTAAFSPVPQFPPPPVSTVAAAITGVASGGSYDYTITLTNTGSTALNSFWYGWTTGGNNLPSDPSSAANSLGWANTLSGNSIMWVNSSGTALAPGASATFTFVSSSTPTAITTAPSGESVAYVGGIDFSEDAAGDSTAAFSPVPQIPPPAVPTVTAAITGFATNGSYEYTITLTNTSAIALNSFWYGWTTSGNNLPSDPTSAANSLGWSNDLSGNSIKWTNSTGTALAPGASATFTFVSSSTPSAITTTPSGESVAYTGGIDFSEDTAGDSTAAFSPLPQFPPPVVPTVTAAITGVAADGSYEYTITLTNTSAIALNSFWYGWTTSGNNLPSDPTSAANSLGWSNALSGNSIMWTNSTGTALAPGASTTFTFVSSSTPSAITTAPSGESVAYAGGIDFSEDVAGDSTAAFSPVLQTPPPVVPTVTAAITGVASNGSYEYTITLTNTSAIALNSFWYGWTTSGNNLPSNPTSAANSLGWSNALSGNSIMWTNSTGTALAPGASATFTFVSSSTPSAITTSPSGESVAYVGAIDFSQDVAGDSTAVFSPTLVTPPGPVLIVSLNPAGSGTGASNSIVLMWPTNNAGVILQSTTNLVAPTVWATVSPAPVVVGGQYTVTNIISGPQQFFRLVTP